MHDLDLAALLERSSSLLLRHEHREVLRIVADALEKEEARLSGGTLGFGRLRLARARALRGLERHRLALPLTAELVEAREPALRAEAGAERAQLLLETWGDLEEVVAVGRLAARGARQHLEGARAASVVREAMGAVALAFARKRAPEAATRALDEATAWVGDGVVLGAARARVWLELDERERARDELERFRGADEPEAARLLALGCARLARVVGDFAAAHRELDALGAPSPCDLAPREERLACWLSERRFELALVATDELLAASPASDRARQRHLSRAELLLELGREGEARAELERVADDAHDDGPGRDARRTLRALSSAGPSPRRARITGLGSVTQLRNHCAPACCELLLRFYGKAAEQTDIAKQIKREHGTPLWAMRAYLEGAGLHVRRVEAALPLMRALLDAGVPFVMSEEYSTTHHVAIAVGYDDARAVLEVQDPMTHELRQTPYEVLPRLLAMANDGVIVAVPDEPARRAALDALGAHETRYLALTDDAFRALDEGELARATALLDESIGLCRAYEMSWIGKFQVARKRREDDPTALRELDAILATMLELWPDDEWPRQYQGYAAYHAERTEEALRAFELARDRDDGDANNWAMIGDCLIELGRAGEAVRPLHEALRRMPWHVRANENLAGLLVDRGYLGEAAALSEAALELHPENPFNHEVAARLALAEGRHADAERAAARALELDGSRERAVVHRARALVGLGRRDEACELLRARGEASPRARVGVADALFEQGAHDDAIAVCDALLEGAPTHLAARAIKGAALAAKASSLEGQAGALEQGLELLGAVVHERPDYGWALAELGRAHLAMGRAREAVTELAASLTFADEARVRLTFAEALLAVGLGAEASHQAELAMKRSGAPEEDVVRAARVVVVASGLEAARRLVEAASARGAPLSTPWLRALGGERVAVEPALVRRFVCAVGGVLRRLNDAEPSLLAGRARPSAEAAYVLREWWDVTTTLGARQCLAWLAREGHRVRLSRSSGRTQASLVAWDLARASNVAAWSYGACLLSQQEAYAHMLATARVVQLVYGSFAELGEAYARGRALWAEDDGPDHELTRALEQLVAPGGEWHDLPWDVPLVEHELSAEPVVELTPEPGARLDDVVARAIALGVDPTTTTIRLRLTAGTYRASLRPEGALELVGEPGARLEPASDAPLVRVSSGEAGVLLRGLELSARDASGELDAVVVDDGFVRLESCVIEADKRAIDVQEDEGIAVAVDTTLRASWLGALARKGLVVLERCHVDDMRLLGVECMPGARAQLHDSSIAQSAGVGLRAGGHVVAKGLRVTRCESSSVALLEGGELELDESRLEHGRQCALFVAPGAKRLRASEVVTEGHGAHDVQIQWVTESAELTGCRFLGAEQVGVLLAPGKNVLLRGCTVKGSKLAALRVDGEALAWSEAPKVLDLVVEGPREGGAVYVHGGALTLERMTATDTPIVAVEVEGGRLRASGLTLARARGVGVSVHRGGFAHLHETRVTDTEGPSIQVSSGSFARLSGCTLERAPRGIEVNGGSFVVSSGSTLSGHVLSLLVAGSSRAWLSDDVLRDAGEDTLFVQEGSTVLAERLTSEGRQITLRDSRARLEACVSRGSDAAGIAVLGGELYVRGGEVTGPAYAAIEAQEGARVLLDGVGIDPASTGQTGLFAHEGATLAMRSGGLRPGSEGHVEVEAGSTVTLVDVELEALPKVSGEGRFSSTQTGADAQADEVQRELERALLEEDWPEQLRDAAARQAGEGDDGGEGDDVEDEDETDGDEGDEDEDDEDDEDRDAGDGDEGDEGDEDDEDDEDDDDDDEDRDAGDGDEGEEDQDDDDGDDDDDEDEDEDAETDGADEERAPSLRLGAAPPLLDAQAWVLALGAPLAVLEGDLLDVFGGALRPVRADEATARLRARAAVRTPPALESLLEELLVGGTFSRAWAALAPRLPELRAAVARGEPLDAGTLGLPPRADVPAVLAALDELGGHAVVAGRAWDLCRVVAYAGWGARASLLDPERAFSLAARAAREAQRAFEGFRALGAAIVTGERLERLACGRPVSGALARATRQLARVEGSPYDLSWGTELEGVARPTPLRARHPVAPGERLADAIARCAPGDVIELARGRHFIDGLACVGELELVGPREAELVVGAMGLTVEGGALRLEGLTLRGDPGGLALVARDGHAHLEDVDVHGVDLGLVLDGDRAEVQLERSSVRARRAAVAMTGSGLFVCHASALAGEVALRLTASARADVTASHLTGEQHALEASGASRAYLDVESTLEATSGVAVHLGARATLTR